MFSHLSSLVSDNCHGHRATRHVMAPSRFRRDGENEKFAAFGRGCLGTFVGSLLGHENAPVLL
jgi:hypothetical protein